MKNVILIICLFLTISLHSQEIPEPKKSNLELLLELGGNLTRFNQPTNGFNFTNLSGYGLSLETGFSWIRIDPTQPLDLTASGRIGYSSFNLQSDSDSFDINRTARGVSLEGGVGLHLQQVVFLTLNLGYFKSLSDAELTTDGLFGGIRLIVKIPTESRLSIGINGLVGGLFKNVVFSEFQSEGLFFVEGGVGVYYRI